MFATPQGEAILTLTFTLCAVILLGPSPSEERQIMERERYTFVLGFRVPRDVLTYPQKGLQPGHEEEESMLREPNKPGEVSDGDDAPVTEVLEASERVEHLFSDYGQLAELADEFIRLSLRQEVDRARCRYTVPLRRPLH